MLMSFAQQFVAAVRRTKKRLLNLIDTPVIILVYHRVTMLPSDPQLLAVSPENFRAHMKHLKLNYPVVRFEDDWSNVKKPSVAVTFDDGYADNVIEALPILEEVGIPATFFISTGNLHTLHEYWWDELERIIIEDRSLPDSFTLNENLSSQTWPTATPAERDMFYQKLHPLMMRLDPARREEWLMQLRRWAQTDKIGREVNRSMSNDELRWFAESKWVTIGAHSVTHTPLSTLAAKQQREEIFSSKQLLEALLGTKLTTFSYPFGRKKDYNQTSVRLCREAGFTKAAANFPGQVHRWTDPYQLPRHLVRNWGLDVFTAEIQSFWTR